MKEGEEKLYTSVDICSSENGLMELPAEVYHSQLPSGMPPHELRLKKGCIVILLRNLNVAQGHCNGTRLRVDELREHVCYRKYFIFCSGNLMHCSYG